MLAECYSWNRSVFHYTSRCTCKPKEIVKILEQKRPVVGDERDPGWLNEQRVEFVRCVSDLESHNHKSHRDVRQINPLSFVNNTTKVLSSAGTKWFRLNFFSKHGNIDRVNGSWPQNTHIHTHSDKLLTPNRLEQSWTVSSVMNLDVDDKFVCVFGARSTLEKHRISVTLVANPIVKT